MGILNPDIFPVSTTLNSHGGLQIGGIDVSSLAATYGTPLYIYDAETIYSKVSTLQSLLRKNYRGKHRISYASKAYISLGMARKLASLDIDLDTSSICEMAIALKGGFAPDRIHLHGNSKTESDLHTAMQADIHAIVVDSLDELEYLVSLAEQEKIRVRIWLRINPGIPVDTHSHVQTGQAGSKFGLSIANGDAAKGIHIAESSRWMDLTGLHTHLGSQLFDSQPYREALEKLFSLAGNESLIIPEISPGGGWGAPYVNQMGSGDATPWIEEISASIMRACTERGLLIPRLTIEPGRWLMAQAGVAVYTITSSKVSENDLTIIAVDGGMADNPRPALYQSRYTACLVQNPLGEPAVNYSVAGKHCESGDILIPKISLPACKRGDLLAIPVSGAYQLSMASNYNLAARPAVLWAENGRAEVLQSREDNANHSWWTNGE